MSVPWTYTTVPKTILNVSTLLVVIIAAACQATRASPVKKVMAVLYSGTSDKGPSEIGTTSLQRTLVAAPC